MGVLVVAYTTIPDRLSGIRRPYQSKAVAFEGDTTRTDSGR